VLVTGYGSASDEDEHGPPPSGERSLGSGFIIESDGYIVTQWRGRPCTRGLTPPVVESSQPTALLKSRPYFPARIVGFNKLIDIAISK
jgi:S1-C subfamily serine protease